MTKDPSPLLGYNNNIRHKNRVFHIQTEDSGVRHPHVITHLFMDGGRILKSVKTSYAEHLGVDRMGDVVRKMMKDQHKGMLIALRDGQFDVVIDGGDAPKPVPRPPTPSLEALAAAAPSKVDDVPPVPLASARTEAAMEAVAPASMTEPGGPPPVAVPHAPPPLPAARPPMRSSPAIAAVVDRVDRVDPVDILELDDTAAPLTVPKPPLDLTPPPANLFRARTGGNYSELGDPSSPPPSKPPPVPAARGASRPPARPPARPASSPPGAVVSKSPGLRSSGSPGSSRPGPLAASGSQRPAASLRRTSSPPPAGADGDNRAPRRPAAAPIVAIAKPSESRYASARPAAIFGQAKPRGGSSIFGEDIISDKSLDEVIMSYLADDLGGSGEGSGKSTSGRPVDPKRRK
jgi:hypothetical protein